MATQRDVYLRQQLAETVAGAMPAPAVAARRRDRFQQRDAQRRLHRPRRGRRRARSPTPDEATLQKFFDERKAAFRAPEYRKVELLAPDARRRRQARRRPRSRRAGRLRRATKQRFGQPERRSVQQIVFPTLDEAKAASDRIKAGTTFDAIAEERKLASAGHRPRRRHARRDHRSQGGRGRLRAGAPTASATPVEGRFGAVLVRVGEVQPEHVKPFDEVAATHQRRDRRRARPRTPCRTCTTRSRTSAPPPSRWPRSPRTGSCTLRTIDAVDRAGRDKAEQARRPARPRGGAEGDLRLRHRRRQRGRRHQGRRLGLVRGHRHRAAARAHPRRGEGRGRRASGRRTRSPAASPTRRPSWSRRSRAARRWRPSRRSSASS